MLIINCIFNPLFHSIILIANAPLWYTLLNRTPLLEYILLVGLDERPKGDLLNAVLTGYALEESLTMVVVLPSSLVVPLR